MTDVISIIYANVNKYFDLSRGDEKYKYAYGGMEHFNFSYEILF
jgi:hypothetical protein